jgi:hypothetical protein
MTARPSLHCCAAVLLLLVLAGCDRIDPYLRDGVWRPSGVNDDNLRAMVALPSDLIMATPPAPANGALGAAALRRLLQDRVRPLPDSGIAQITPVANGAPASSAAPAPSASGATASDGGSN